MYLCDRDTYATDTYATDTYATDTYATDTYATRKFTCSGERDQQKGTGCFLLSLVAPAGHQETPLSGISRLRSFRIR